MNLSEEFCLWGRLQNAPIMYYQDKMRAKGASRTGEKMRE